MVSHSCCRPAPDVRGTRRLRIDVGDQQLLLRVGGDRQTLAIGIEQDRSAHEGRSALSTHPVAGQDEAVVLGRARGGEQVRVERHAEPVGGQRDDVGALQRADARRLREAQVVADQDAEAEAIGLDHGWRVRTRVA